MVSDSSGGARECGWGLSINAAMGCVGVEGGIKGGSGEVANSEALYNCPSALITPSAPVSRRHSSMSLWKRILPFANTGTETADLTARILDQSAKPW